MTQRLRLLVLAVAVYILTALMLGAPLEKRLHSKEKEAVLLQGLPGYADYKQRVRWRIIPFIW